MIFKNPVLRGMYPDPSLCAGPDGKFYMVCSTFQYFPGVPVFESEDLINWKQIGHCLTRKSQLLLERNNTNSGIYAPTIRYNKGRFYMVVTNVENIGNFYVYTDDIYGEWSEPIKVEQSGIDPTIFFDDDDKVYFISNGNDSEGRGYIQISQIDITTGKKLSENEPLWYGTGGRYIEAPHIYKINGWYYLLNAEGGTEYGHMVNYARSKNLMGPYEPCPLNPVLSNRNLGGYSLQGAGHGDLVQAPDGTWWFCHLAFRQLDQYMTYHHLGRETCMEPVVWKDDWFYIGTPVTKNCAFGEKIASGFNEKQGYGVALLETNAPENHKFAPQNLSFSKTFENTSTKLDWCYLCNPDFEKYKLTQNKFTLTAGDLTIDTLKGSPTFIGIRQNEFNETVKVNCKILNDAEGGQAGLSLYLDPLHHYDFYVENCGNKKNVFCKGTIGPVSQVKAQVELAACIETAKLVVIADAFKYVMALESEGGYLELAEFDTRYLSSEVAGGFTGVFLGLYAQNGAVAEFTDFLAQHKE